VPVGNGLVSVPTGGFYSLMGTVPVTRPTPTKPIGTVHITAPDGTSYQVKLWAHAVTQHCAKAGLIMVKNSAVNQQGLPRQFTLNHYLQRHPCVSLIRVLASARTAGRTIGIAEDTITFRNRAAAVGLRTRIMHHQGQLATLLDIGYGMPEGPQNVPPTAPMFVATERNSLIFVRDWYADSSYLGDVLPPLIRFARDVYRGVSNYSK